eukprot:6204796-Pleurochrysis_carterae.AAC.1
MPSAFNLARSCVPPSRQVVHVRDAAYLPPPGMVGAALREPVFLLLVFSHFGEAESYSDTAMVASSPRGARGGRNKRGG